jgi:hypothetical protein
MKNLFSSPSFVLTPLLKDHLTHRPAPMHKTHFAIPAILGSWQSDPGGGGPW